MVNVEFKLGKPQHNPDNKGKQGRQGVGVLDSQLQSLSNPSEILLLVMFSCPSIQSLKMKPWYSL